MHVDGPGFNDLPIEVQPLVLRHAVEASRPRTGRATSEVARNTPPRPNLASSAGTASRRARVVLPPPISHAPTNAFLLPLPTPFPIESIAQRRGETERSPQVAALAQYGRALATTSVPRAEAAGTLGGTRRAARRCVLQGYVLWALSDPRTTHSAPAWTGHQRMLDVVLRSDAAALDDWVRSNGLGVEGRPRNSLYGAKALDLGNIPTITRLAYGAVRLGDGGTSRAAFVDSVVERHADLVGVMSAPEAAAFLDIDPDTLYRWLVDYHEHGTAEGYVVTFGDEDNTESRFRTGALDDMAAQVARPDLLDPVTDWIDANAARHMPDHCVAIAHADPNLFPRFSDLFTIGEAYLVAYSLDADGFDTGLVGVVAEFLPRVHHVTLSRHAQGPLPPSFTTGAENAVSTGRPRQEAHEQGDSEPVGRGLPELVEENAAWPLPWPRAASPFSLAGAPGAAFLLPSPYDS